MSLLADHNLPFAAALLLMAMLTLVQIIGLGGFGVDADADADPSVPAGDVGMVDGLLSIIGIGRVPFMIWLVLFLFVFAALGVSGQSLAAGLIGSPLDPLLAGVIAAVAALPVTGAVARPLARILPRDETTAVSLESLVGRRGMITTGRAAAGYPARTRVLDHHGHAHHVMAEPHDAAAQLLEGDQVLLVRRDGQLFYAVALQDRRLDPQK